MLRGGFLSIGMVVAACGRIGFDGLGGSGGTTPPSAVDISLCPVPPELASSRASAGTYTDATGILRTAGPGVPRCDHDPTTGAPLGLLVEGRRTNYVNVALGSGSSTEGMPLGWQVQHGAGVSAAGTSVMSPTFTGFRETEIRVTSSGANDYWQVMVQQDIPTGAGDYAFSWFIRAPDPSGINWCGLFAQYFTPGYTTNLGRTSTDEFAIPTTTWTRVSTVLHPPANAGAIQATLECTILDTSSYTITLSAPQVELGLRPSSPIVTDGGSPATREPDLVTLARDELTHGDRGTVVFDVRAFDDTDQLHTLFQVDDASATPIQRLGYDAGAWTASFPNAIAAALAAASLPGDHRIGYRFAPTASAVAVDGAIGFGGPVEPLTGGTARLGAASGGANALFGAISRLRYWTTELDDAELASATN